MRAQHFPIQDVTWPPRMSAFALLPSSRAPHALVATGTVDGYYGTDAVDNCAGKAVWGLPLDCQLVFFVGSREDLAEVFPFQISGHNFSLKVSELLGWEFYFPLPAYPSSLRVLFLLVENSIQNLGLNRSLAYHSSVVVGTFGIGQRCSLET